LRRPKSKAISGNDLGFGTSATINNQRILNKDGSSNILRTGLPFFRSSDTYNLLITMSWTRFWVLIGIAYLLINFTFAWIYVSVGMEHMNGVSGHSAFDQFFDAFFFSAQTISTVGYGHISPKGFTTSTIAAFESMLGLLAFALATGLLYGRFSRPSAKIIYSERMLVAPYKHGQALMFRLANERSSQLIEVEAQVLLSINEETAGKTSRRFYNLDLEVKRINILTLSWTIVHPLDDSSPLSGMSKEDLDQLDAEFVVLIKAFDDTFSQTVHSRTSYQNEEIVWDAKFIPVFGPGEDGRTIIDLSKVGDYQKI